MFQKNNTVIPKVVKSAQYLDFWVHFYKESSQVFQKVKCYILFCWSQGWWLSEVHWNSLSIIVEKLFYFSLLYRLNGILRKREKDLSKPFLLLLCFYCNPPSVICIPKWTTFFLSLFFWFCPFLFLSRSLSFQLRKSGWDLLHNCLLVGEVAPEHRKVYSLPPRLISLRLQCYQLGKLEIQDGNWAWVQFVSGSS